MALTTYTHIILLNTRFDAIRSIGCDNGIQRLIMSVHRNALIGDVTYVQLTARRQTMMIRTSMIIIYYLCQQAYSDL